MTIDYQVQGEGEPLVLIPGFAAGGWIWFRQVPQLSSKFRVITFDPRGVGESRLNSEPLTIRLLADDVARLLNELRIDRAHILGASFGGFVAQEFALAHSEMTASLVLCCTSFGGPSHVAPSMETLAALASTNGFNTEERVRKNLLPGFSTEFREDHSDEVEQTVKLRLQSPVTETTYRAQLVAAVEFNVESRVAEINAPTLILSGDADAIVPVENSRNLAQAIPSAQLHVVDGGSHLFFIEQPEEFNSIVSAFLSNLE